MGAGTPEMSAIGRGTCRWIMDGLWAMFDFEQDKFIEGRKAITWKAHWVIGWDFMAREYRAVVVDSNGTTGHFRAEIEGDKLIMESISEMTMMGRHVKFRFIQDHTDPEAIVWINEFSINNGPWRLLEEYVVKPSE